MSVRPPSFSSPSAQALTVTTTPEQRTQAGSKLLLRLCPLSARHVRGRSACVVVSNYNAHQATAALLVAISSPSVLKQDCVVMLSRQKVSGLSLSEYALFVPSCSVAHNLYRSRSFVEGSDCAILTAEPCVVVRDAPHKREDAGTTNSQLFDQVMVG